MDTPSSGFGDFDEVYRGYETARIVLLPIPFDLTSSWQKGADAGPRALIEASYYLENFDIETGTEVHRHGIHTAGEIHADDPETMVSAASQQVRQLLEDGKFVVTLGGEHSVSIGPIAACAEKWPSLSVLHIDAHSDRRDTYHDTPLSHACVMARAQEMAQDVVSVGIRSMDASEKARLIQDTVIYGHEIPTTPDWIAQAVNALHGPVYVTIDLDAFDHSVMPSTGTPEPGGLSWHDMTSLLKAVAAQRRIVAFDVVELCPSPHNKAPDFAAAKLVQTFLSYIFAEESPRST